MAGTIKCPDIIEGEAKKEWDRVTKLLKKAGVLTHFDRGIIAAYCAAWGTMYNAEKSLNKMGLVVKTRNNNVIPNPLLGIRNKAAGMVEKFSESLGFTPKSRKGGRAGGRGRSAKDFMRAVDDD